MRRAAKVDRNQAEIVAALRKAGYAVQILSMVGQGIPDILVGVPTGKADGSNVNLLMEIKMPGETLTPDEAEWHAAWRGQVAIVTSAEEALEYAFLFRCVERTD